MKPHLSSPQSCVAVCLALLLAAPAGMLHARGAADDRCEQRLAPHDPSAHHATAPRDRRSERSDHCILCHWLHSLRLVRAVCAAAADVSGGDTRVSADISDIILRLLAGNLAGRSPPA